MRHVLEERERLPERGVDPRRRREEGANAREARARPHEPAAFDPGGSFTDERFRLCPLVDRRERFCQVERDEPVPGARCLRRELARRHLQARRRLLEPAEGQQRPTEVQLDACVRSSGRVRVSERGGERVLAGDEVPAHRLHLDPDPVGLLETPALADLLRQRKRVRRPRPRRVYASADQLQRCARV